MPTVIDTLIVKLGMDPKDFTKGEKQVAASVLETKRSVGRANEEMGQSFTKLAGKLLGLVSAVAIVRKLISAASDLNKETRQLGIDSQNYGIAANRLRNFQNAAEMMGGKAEDVTRSVEGLQKAVYDLTVTGKSSEQLEMLTRLGVAFQDSTGHARDFHDIVLDTADALERAQKNGTLNKTEAFFAAKSAGLDDGTARLALLGRSGAEAELAKQEARRQVTERDTAAADRNERLRSNVTQGATAVGIGALTNTTEGVEGAVGMAQRGVSALAGAADRASSSLADLADNIMGKIHANRTGRAAYESTIQAAAKANGIEPELLAGVLKTESNFNPLAKSAAGAVGIAQLMPKYFPGAGNDPDADIHTSARLLRGLHDDAVKAGDDDNAAWQTALQGYNAGQTRVRNSRKPGGKPLAQETLDYPGKVLAAAQARPSPGATKGSDGSVTNNIGPITVQTAATDANGIATDLNGAVRRKMLAAQVEPGMQ